MPPGNVATAAPNEYGHTSSGDSHSSKTMSTSERIKQVERNISHMSKIRPMIRNAIYCQPIDVEADFEIPCHPKSSQQIEFLKESVQENFLFGDLTPKECEQIVGAMQPAMAYAGTKIIQQGDKGDFFYILEVGTITFEVDGVVVGTCGPGGSFGELALLYNSPRAATCIAATDANLWKVCRSTFRRLLVRCDRHHQSEMEALISKIPLFKDLDFVTVSKFVKSMTPVKFKAGTRIVQKGEEGSVFYIIQEGNVTLHDIGLGDSRLEDLVLGPGSWFGERALLTGEVRAANATALNDVGTYAMDRETFDASIGPLENVLKRGMRLNAIKTLPIFAKSNLTGFEIDQLVDQVREVCYKKGERLAETGEPYQMNIWIIIHGRLLVYSEKKDTLYNLKSGDYFGDKSIKGDPNHLSSHTATCEENLTTWLLTLDQIESVIGDIVRLGKTEDFAKSKPERSIQMGDLKRHKMIGKGAFGKVWLVSYEKPTDTEPIMITYAMKTINKAEILKANLGAAVVREKELLAFLDHPFILRLVASYQDENNLYMLLPLIIGGELYSVLHKQKSMERGLHNNSSAFYCACILEALGHFHQRQIAYRDL